MRVAPKLDEIAEIYIDESSQNNHRYLVLGGVILMLTSAAELNGLIMKARLPELPAHEAKWTRVSKKKLAAYKRIVDVLVKNSHLMHFHSLVVDTTLVDHQRFNAGSREIGFNKEIYQLAMKFSRLYSKDSYHLYPDYRDTTQKPEDLRVILNCGCRKNGDPRDWPFRRCQFSVSKKTPLLQLVDILVGTIAYRLNGHDKEPNAALAKNELSSYVLAIAVLLDVKDIPQVGPLQWGRINKAFFSRVSH
jgi:hypothetical protein